MSTPANRSYFTPSPKLLDFITKVHRRVYQATGGLFGAVVPQRAEEGKGFFLRPITILLLTTTGRKSGLARTVPLPYLEYDGRTFLVASNSGQDKHPAWYLNLRDNPEVQVQVRWRRRAARAVTLEGAERAAMWARVSDDWPRYRVYQEGTTREIPLVEIR